MCSPRPTPSASAGRCGSAGGPSFPAVHVVAARHACPEAALARTPLPLRVYRYIRVSIHVFQGIATTAFVFPLIELSRRRALIKRWSNRLLRMMNVDARVQGLPAEGLPGNVLIVANHISWLDIFVLNSVEPGRFIAKSELEEWPLVGHLIAGCGTLFLDRSSRRDAHRINERARTVLAAGDTITIFPEGTTTDGTALLAFHGSLLQPVVDARGHVQPVAIRYCSVDGSYNGAPAYVGDTSFMSSFWRVLGERRLVIEVTLSPALSAAGRHRRELSREAENAIRAALGLAAAGSAPGTASNPPT
jgi:1-acyl-sn-glycerol-3-phosphate acyltransferase